MKKHIISLVVILLAFFQISTAQNEGFSYQAVITDGSGAVLSEASSVSLRLSIIKESITGNVVYAETFSTATSLGGIISVVIGKGIPVLGDFSSIDWSDGDYFIQTAVDINGGSSYVVMGTSQILSVPFSNYSNTTQSICSKSDDSITRISNPKSGQLVFCFNCGTAGEMQVYNGTTWTNMMGGARQTAVPR